MTVSDYNYIRFYKLAQDKRSSENKNKCVPKSDKSSHEVCVFSCYSYPYLPLFNPIFQPSRSPHTMTRKNKTYFEVISFRMKHMQMLAV